MMGTCTYRGFTVCVYFYYISGVEMMYVFLKTYFYFYLVSLIGFKIQICIKIRFYLPRGKRCLLHGPDKDKNKIITKLVNRIFRKP